MRPYLAVIKDSFREAFSSRVLWILLVLITLFLLLLSPLSLPEEAGTVLQRSDFLNIRGFITALAESEARAESSPEKYLWQKLSDDLKKEIEGIDEEKVELWQLMSVQSRLMTEMNRLMEQKDFYDENVWNSIELDDETQALLNRGPDRLAEEETARLNRLLLDAAFPDSISPAQATAVRVAYFGYKFTGPLPLSPEEVRQTVQIVISQLMIYLAGVIGVLIAILVTSSIIPQMFEAGAIDLLLSKPVSRSFLFLTKFFGGCAFILLNVTYFIVGLWLIVGLRYDLWNAKLLLCIPVFLFLFAIYYSVSALAGVIWKNAVISVVFTIVFWGACFSIGLARNLIDSILNPHRHSVVVPAGETLIVTNKSGEAFHWNPDRNRWESIFEGAGAGPMTFGFFYPLIGPVYDSRGDRIVAVHIQSLGVERFGGTGTLLIGSRKNDWARQESIQTPVGADLPLIDPRGRIILAGVGGIHRLELDPMQDSVKQGEFVNIGGPEPGLPWQTPFHATMHPDSGDLLVFHRGMLSELKQNQEGNYLLSRSNNLETEEPALLAYAGKSLVVALGNGEIRVAKDPLCKDYESFEPYGNNKPRSVLASDDGRWLAVLFHHRRLWLYDSLDQKVISSSVSGQGDISAVAFADKNSLLVSTGFGCVNKYQLDPVEFQEEFEEPAETLELVYRYFLNPLYTVFPKPGELDYLVSYLLTDQETQAVRGQEQNLQAERAVLNIWTPLWSNLAFLAVMLTLTCLYISRRDF